MKPGTFVWCKCFWGIIQKNDILLVLLEKTVQLPPSDRIEDPDGTTTETYFLSMLTGTIMIIDRFDLCLENAFEVYNPS
jgi:hypothetical protein